MSTTSFSDVTFTTIEPGLATPALITEVAHLFDLTIAWLNAHGSEQWGTSAVSNDTIFLSRLTIFSDCLITLARSPSGTLLGLIGVQDKRPFPEHIPPLANGEEEIYVHVLITNKKKAPRGLGSELVERGAKKVAREKGVSVLRVDCWGGGDGQLVRLYGRMGFKMTDIRWTDQRRWGVDDWPCQVLEMRLEN